MTANDCTDPEHPFGEHCSVTDGCDVPHADDESEDQAMKYLTSGLDKLDSSRIDAALADFSATMATSLYEIRTAFLGLAQSEALQSLLAACEAAITPAHTVTVPMSDDTDAVDPIDDIAAKAAPHWIAGVIVGRVKALLDEAPVNHTYTEPSGTRNARYPGSVYDAVAVDVLASLRNHLDLFKDGVIEGSDLGEMIDVIQGRQP